MLRLALAILVASASMAHADPPGLTPAVAMPAAPDADVDEPKSRGLAVLLSIGTTFGGFLTLASAEREGTALVGTALMIVGPSTGRWYAGEASLSGIGLRSLATVSMIYGFAALIGSECGYDEYEDDYYASSCEDDQSLASALVIGGGALFIGSALVDVVLADRAARDYNARHLTVRPMIQTPAGGATGLALAGRF